MQQQHIPHNGAGEPPAPAATAGPQKPRVIWVGRAGGQAVWMRLCGCAAVVFAEAESVVHAHACEGGSRAGKPRTEANPETSVGVLDVVQPQDGLGGEVLARLAFRANSIQKGLLYLHTPFYEVDHVKVRAPLCRKPVIGMAPARRMDEGSQMSASFAGARGSHRDIHEPGRRRDRHP